MDAELLVGRILEDEGLIAGLDEEAASVLLQWLIPQAEALARRPDAASRVEQLCQVARDIARRVTRDCHSDQRTTLEQLLAQQGIAFSS